MLERVTPLMLGLTFTTRSPWASTMRTTLIDRRIGASCTSFLGSTTLQAPVAARVYKFPSCQRPENGDTIMAAHGLADGAVGLAKRTCVSKPVMSLARCANYQFGWTQQPPYT